MALASRKAASRKCRMAPVAQPILRPKDPAQQGQALVEYIIMLAVGIALTIALQKGLRSTTGTIWAYYAQTIAAGCPGQCQKDKQTLRW